MSIQNEDVRREREPPDRQSALDTEQREKSSLPVDARAVSTTETAAAATSGAQREERECVVYWYSIQ
jgi:hypothetical protein